MRGEVQGDVSFLSVPEGRSPLAESGLFLIEGWAEL